MITKEMYLLKYKREEKNFNSMQNYVIIGKAWTHYNISRQLDEFYNLFINQVRCEDTFITSSIYKDKAIIEFKGGRIDLEIDKATYESEE